MKSLPVRFIDSTILGTLIILGAAIIFSFTLLPRITSAETVLVTSVTATSSNLYTNAGFATTSRVTTGDDVKYQLNLDATPWVAPQINIFSMGSTTMSGSGASWFYSTTSATTWTEGPITFKISVGSTTAATVGTTTVTQASVTTNVTYDKTAPTLSSVSWSDVDGSTNISGTDTLAFTFSETMATTTLSGADLATVLALSGSHVFSTTTAPTWNTAGTILTVTLGAASTVAHGDTVDPTSDVKDSVGIADATGSALTITDNVDPSAPTGLADTTRSSSLQIVLASVGSTDIHYTTDGTTPTCTTGTTYSTDFSISQTTTLKAVGCDVADNDSTIVTAVYTFESSGSSGSSGGGRATPAVPATKLVGCVPGSGDLFDTTSGKSCTVSATPAVPAGGCSSGNLFNTTTGKPCTNAAVRAFKLDSTVGSIGEEVRALQQFLNTHGYTVASSGPGSSGNETTTFGGLTRAAVIKYQKAKGITPAVGYFGPLTRASINAEQ